MPRYFMYTLGDESIPFEPPTDDLMERMGALVQREIESGRLVQTGGFVPSAYGGCTVSLQDGQYTVTDGPFSEAKELIGGWALVDAKDRDEAIAMTKEFLSIVGGGESRIRQVMGPEEDQWGDPESREQLLKPLG
jgi:hypothetical protein